MCLGVWVEVVIHVHTVDVVPAHEVEDDIFRQLSNGRLARIHPLIGPVPVHEHWMGATDVRGRCDFLH